VWLLCYVGNCAFRLCLYRTEVIKATTKMATKLVAVVGATGGTGIGVVEQALKKGYNVRVLARNLKAFSPEVMSNPAFEGRQGDVKSEADLTSLLTGGVTDLVVALGGHRNDTICSEA